MRHCTECRVLLLYKVIELFIFLFLCSLQNGSTSTDLSCAKLGPILQRDLSPDLDLNLRLWSKNFVNRMLSLWSYT